MGRLDDILAKLREYRWINYSGYDRIADYVRDGSDAALRAIPAPGQYSYWTSELTRALRDPADWREEDCRLAHVLLHLGADNVLWEWLDHLLAREGPSQDFFTVVARECRGWSTSKVAANALQRLGRFVRDGQPTSFGRYLLALSKKDLERAVKSAECANAAEFVALLLDHGPERLDAVLSTVLDRLCLKSDRAQVFQVLLQKCGDRYEQFIAKRTEKEKDRWAQFCALQVLHAYAPERYGSTALAISRRALKGNWQKVNRDQVAEWMAGNLGVEVVPDLTEFAGKATRQHDVAGMAHTADTQLGSAAVPVFKALLANENADVRAVGVESLMRLQSPEHEQAVEAELRRELGEKSADRVLKSLTLAMKWKPERILDVLWKLLEHRSRPVRMAAARSMASCGDAVVDESAALLVHKKADVRIAAVEILASIGSERATTALEQRLDEESSEDVRDQMLFGLEAAWNAQGRETTKTDIAARIKRTKDKLEDPVADWLAEDTLPTLKWTDGKRLSNREVRYLLYRQSRAKEIRPDPEAAAVYRLIDRSRSGSFAAAVLAAFLQSGQEATDRWAMTVAGMLGDDAVVPVLAAQIRSWAESNRGKMAEWAVQALALLGTDSALLAVDAMAIRYRTKMKNIGRAAAESFALAAERMGVTPDELGDRVVPWLCFAPNETCLIDAGQKQYEVRIGPDLKLRYIETKKGKAVKSLPKSVSADVKTEMKGVAANLREVVKAQTLRLENLLVRQRRWSATRWRELFLPHPILLPFATRLVWGTYDDSGQLCGLFRALEDRTLTTNADDAYELPDDASVGLVHPLEIDDQTRTAWLTHLADYEIEPPFPQLEREVVNAAEDQHDQKNYLALDGAVLNGMTFKGRAERLGWVRGSVVDAGSVSGYHKSFPTAGVDVIIGIEGMFMGMDMYDEITLGPVLFVRDGTVKYGSYQYDEPSDESDPRVMRFGDVAAIAFSEAMGDLRRIAGEKAGNSSE